MFRHASLNRIYRLVWSESRNAFVAVAENTRAHGKRSSAVGAIAVALIGGSSTLHAAAPTTVVPTGGNTKAYIAPNGVPVVDINTANAAGVSHNQYTNYNVDAKGLVLNNGNSDQMARQSQLAGQVMANANLSSQASLILNEVVAPNRSQLSGYTEVLGGKADVVVANPYGITCSGCGFINTDRVTLTTGTPMFGSNGALNGFRVTQGDLLINGSGLNGSAQQILDLVARSIKIDGQINANDLSLTAGANQWNYASRSVTGTLTPTDTTPTYAIDSTVLGGMYANRIKIVATEAGVGVRMLGEAAATASDFALDASGKIVLQNKLSAAHDVHIGTTAVDTDALTLNDANVTATNNLDLSAAGGAIFNGGMLLAKNNFTLNAGTLTDAATTTAAQDNNTRFANGNLQIHVNGDADLNGVSYGSGNAFNANVGNLNIGASGAMLYSGSTFDLTATNNLNLANAAVQSAAAMHLIAQDGTVTTSNGADQGIKATSGDIVINANGATNAGKISADAGALTLQVDSLTNSGTVHSAQALSITDQSGSGTENINNSGTMISDAALSFTASDVTNTGTTQAANGTTIDANSVNNSGTLIGSTAANADTTINSNTLTNSGTLQSAHDLNLNVANTLTNSNKLLASHDLLTAAKNSGSTLTVNNQSGGALQAGNLLQLQGTAGAHNLAFNTQAGSTAQGTRLNVIAASLNNAGKLQGHANGANFDISGTLANWGDVLSDAGLDITADTITNDGTVQSTSTSTTTANNLTNNGTWIASSATGNSATFNTNTLTNTGTLQSANDLSLSVRNALTNSNKILASHDLLIEASINGTTLAVNNQGSGVLQADNLLQMRGTGGAINVNFTNSAAAKAWANRLNVIVASLNNSGLMQGGSGASTLTVNGALTNSSGAKILLSTDASGSGTVNADTLINAGTLQSTGTTAINISSILTNSGTTLSTGAMTIRGRTASNYSINDTGRLESSGLLDIKGYNAGNAANITVGANGVLRGGSMDMNAGTLTVSDNGSSGGIVNTTGNMTLALSTLSFGGSNSKIVGATSTGNTSITLANSFSNPGAIHSGGNLTFNLPALTNTSTGGISALGTLTINATAGDLYNAGALYGGNQLTLSTTGTFTNYASNSGFVGTLDSSGSMNISAVTFINNSAINAVQNITITAATFRNEVPGGDTRTWGAYSTKTHTQTGHDSQGYNGHGCCDQYETWYYTDTWYRDQYYSGGTPAFKPQIIGGNTITIQNFNVGKNLGAVISAPNVNIIGNSGATFTNDSLDLQRESVTETYAQEIKYIAAGPAEYYNDFDDNYHRGSATTTTTSSISSLGAGVYANSGHLVVNVSGVTNAGNPLTASVSTTSASGASAGTTTTGASKVAGATAIGGVNPVTGAPTISFGGLTISLPTNPNGNFVITKDPGAKYLVESNPLYAVGSNFVGSDYLEDRLGYNPDTLTKRLGDSNYEAYLMRQQLIQQLGTNIINGYASEAGQMQGLMDNAATQAKQLGLTFGQAPTAAQLANLKSDMVWMVETVVAGQKVLAPVVYLSAATKSNYESGNAVFAGSNVNMNVDTFANTGGTVSGDKQLSITAKGDITNTSGTIKGGDVTLASTGGSIINQTYTSTTGDASSTQATTVGKQASIQSTGNLNVDAAKDITNLGANMAAGGDASLSAGGNVTFDTVENKNANTTHTSSSNGFTSTSTTTTVATTEQIKSGLTSGGNLTVKSKNDVTFAGTDVKADGNADIDAKGNVNFLARANTNETISSTSTSGMGVGGGIAGIQTTDTDDFHSRNVGSSLTVGGDAKLNAGKDLTLEGSKADIKGNADINATNVNILAGKDVDRTTTTTTTTTFMKVDSGSSDSSSGSQSGSSASAGDGAAGAEASAGAQADANASGGLKFAETTTDTKKTYDQTSVASSLNVGGNANINAKDTVKLVGSNVDVGGDANVKATDVKILAAQDIHTSSETTSTTSIGLMASSENKASANASADASADSNNMDARANANAKAEASNNNDVTLMSTSTTTTDSLEINNKGSSIKSGGNMSIDASNKLTTQGSSVESGGDMNLKAKDIENLAATDVKTTTTTSNTTTVGLYNENKASAEANATAGANGIGMTTADASADASASASAEVGIKAQNTQTSNTEGSTTAITSSFKSGGNMTRTASNNITDVGTQIEAGGDFTQSAKTIDSKAAKNTTFSSSSSETNTAKLGIYAEANASAGASADSSGETKAEAGANVGAGVHASYENQKDASSSNSSTAVVSNIKAGGNINSTSSGKTSLEGTNLTSGKDTNIDAGSLDYKAAQNTSSNSSSSSNINADVKAGIQRGTGSGAKLDIAGGYGQQQSSDASTEAVTGSINSGGKLNIKTKDDARFEGTQLNSGSDANINAGGNVTFDAAKNTQKSSAEGFDVSASLSLSKSKSGDKEGSTGVEGGYNKSSSDASQAVVGGINSGGKLNVSAGKNATFEGTNIASAGDAAISAKDNLAFNAAHDTSSSESLNINASLSASGSKGKNEETGGSKSSKSAGLEAGADYSKDKSSTAKVGSISSGGDLKLSSGKDTTLEGTQVDAGGTAKIDAGGNVNVKAAKSTSESLSVGGSIGGSVESNKENDSTGKQTKSEKTGSGDLSLSLEGGKSSTATVASIKSGKGTDISAGKNATLEGTQLSSNGDTNISAGGDVNLTAAKSTDIHGGIAGSLADGGAKLNKAEIGGGVENQTANIDTAGNLNIKSGGKTTLEGTQANAGGNANIDAAGGTEKKTVVSGSGEIGLNKADASLDVQKTSIQSEGRTLVAMTAGSEIKSSVALPANIPAGKKVEAVTADGKPLPSWLSFDAKTGTFVGTPPADFKGNLNVVVKVPNENGGVTEVPLRFQGQ